MVTRQTGAKQKRAAPFTGQPSITIQAQLYLSRVSVGCCVLTATVRVSNLAGYPADTCKEAFSDTS